MAWQSSLWARWLGWTALYALLVYGGGALYSAINPWPVPGTVGSVLAWLVPALPAFVIGVRFCSLWWGLGPLATFGLPFAVVVVVGLISGVSAHALVWVILPGALIGLGSLLYGLIGLAGVWWGERRQDPDAGSPTAELPPLDVRP